MQRHMIRKSRQIANAFCCNTSACCAARSEILKAVTGLLDDTASHNTLNTSSLAWRCSLHVNQQAHPQKRTRACLCMLGAVIDGVKHCLTSYRVMRSTMPSQRAHSPKRANISCWQRWYSVLFTPLGQRMSRQSRGMTSLLTQLEGMSGSPATQNKGWDKPAESCQQIAGEQLAYPAEGHVRQPCRPSRGPSEPAEVTSLKKKRPAPQQAAEGGMQYW